MGVDKQGEREAFEKYASDGPKWWWMSRGEAHQRWLVWQARASHDAALREELVTTLLLLRNHTSVSSNQIEIIDAAINKVKGAKLMEQVAKLFYNMLTSDGEKTVLAAAFILLRMEGDNTEKGIAKRMHSIASELEKIEELF